MLLITTLLRQSDWNCSNEGLMLETAAFYPLRWLISIFNSVVNTKLPATLSHRCSTTVSLETFPVFITTAELPLIKKLLPTKIVLFVIAFCNSIYLQAVS